MRSSVDLTPRRNSVRSELLFGAGFGLLAAHILIVGILTADRIGHWVLLASLAVVPLLIAVLTVAVVDRVTLNPWWFFAGALLVSVFVAPAFAYVYAFTILAPPDAVDFDPVWVFLVPILTPAGLLGGAIMHVVARRFRRSPE